MMDYRVGDTRDLIADIPDGSVSLVACSPPFLALRSYLPADHHAKHAEIGSEPDPATFLDTLLALTAEWGRVLAPWGSIAIELGDSYSGGRGEGTDTRSPDSTRYRGWADGDLTSKSGPGWPRAKSLALIPQLYATSLAYGRNLLTGQPSPAGQWLVRNVVVWHRPNPAVGALGDKYRPSTSYITVATRSPKRWFDLTAVRGDLKVPEAATLAGARMNRTSFAHPGDSRASLAAGGARTDRPMMSNPAGAPPLDAWFDEHDTWTITTQPSRLAHYAMWPPKLAERLVLSMCPAEVCRNCGEPRRRVERSERVQIRPNHVTPSMAARSSDAEFLSHGLRVAHTLGWTDCGHEDYEPGRVLEPFAGTGTTMCVAELHGRDSIGIDLDPRNRDLLPARMNEVRRALFGTKPEVPGQLDMFGEAS